MPLPDGVKSSLPTGAYNLRRRRQTKDAEGVECRRQFPLWVGGTWPEVWHPCEFSCQREQRQARLTMPSAAKLGRSQRSPSPQRQVHIQRKPSRGIARAYDGIGIEAERRRHQAPFTIARRRSRIPTKRKLRQLLPEFLRLHEKLLLLSSSCGRAVGVGINVHEFLRSAFLTAPLQVV